MRPGSGLAIRHPRDRRQREPGSSSRAGRAYGHRRWLRPEGNRGVPRERLREGEPDMVGWRGTEVLPEGAGFQDLTPRGAGGSIGGEIALVISGAAKPPPLHRLVRQPCPLAVGEKGLSTVAIGASELFPRGSCPRSLCSAGHESAAWFGRNQRTWILTHSLPGTSRGVLISRRG